jgi:hypothetical protein
LLICCLQLSCLVVDYSCANPIRAHPQWKSYFYTNSFGGILEAIHAQKGQSDLDALGNNLSPVELGTLKALLVSKLPKDVTDHSKAQLQCLPLLYTNYNGAKRATLYSPELWIPPKMFLDLRKVVPSITHGPFVLCSKMDDFKLADAIGYKRLDEENFLMKLMELIIGHSFVADERDKLIIYILDNIKGVFKNHHQLLAQFAFIPTSQGETRAETRKPSELYHPTKCHEANVLLQDPCCFPAEKFTNNLQALSLLGLRTSFQPAVLESVVEQIALKPTTSVSREQGMKLFELLSVKSQEYCNVEFSRLFTKMKTHPCVPVRECPSEYLLLTPLPFLFLLFFSLFLTSNLSYNFMEMQCPNCVWRSSTATFKGTFEQLHSKYYRYCGYSPKSTTCHGIQLLFLIFYFPS